MEITDVELQELLTEISMEEDDNPDVLFDQLSAIKNRYNTPSRKLPECQLGTIVTASAPKDYKSLLAAGIETSLMNSKKVWYSTIVHCLIAHQVRQMILEVRKYTLLNTGEM
jgi:hypothetical protein